MYASFPTIQRRGFLALFLMVLLSLMTVHPYCLSPSIKSPSFASMDRRRLVGPLLANPLRKKQQKSDDNDDDDDMNIEELGFADDVKEFLHAAQALAEKERIKVDVDSDIFDDDEEEVDMDTDEADIDDTDNDDSNVHLDSKVVTSIDDIEVADEDNDSLQSEVIQSDQTMEWKRDVESIIRDVITKQNVYLQKITWKGGRIEVIITANDDPDDPAGPSSGVLSMCHRMMYEAFELRESDLAVVTRYEIIVASPGIGEVLRSDRDFVSFKGFTVSVSTTEIFKKKTAFEGTLVERTEEYVSISQKGRLIKVPRNVIAEVRLPKPKYESTDTEMRKLR